jgi:hypothetical protein
MQATAEGAKLPFVARLFNGCSLLHFVTNYRYSVYLLY